MHGPGRRCGHHLPVHRYAIAGCVHALDVCGVVLALCAVGGVIGGTSANGRARQHAGAAVGAGAVPTTVLPTAAALAFCWAVVPPICWKANWRQL